MSEKKRAVVICPGRGTYNREELGYLTRHHSDKHEFISGLDAYRRDCGQTSISELDSAKSYRMSQHNTGDNASAVIYACAMADFQSINADEFDIVAVTGNSMGWYLALAAGGAVDFQQGLHIVNTMGTWMHQQAEGGQVIYPLCNEQWVRDETLNRNLQLTIEELNKDPSNHISLSIDLGLMAVLAANSKGVAKLLNTLPKVQDRYPFALPNHGAFHSELMRSISDQALGNFASEDFSQPRIPLIDGKGHIWQPYSTDTNDLLKYTFDDQVCTTYNYSLAIEVACKEFAPDCLIILGPGSTLGPPTAQELIKQKWQGISSKNVFKELQASSPFVLSMGLDDQRQHVIS